MRSLRAWSALTAGPHLLLPSRRLPAGDLGQRRALETLVRVSEKQGQEDRALAPAAEREPRVERLGRRPPASPVPRAAPRRATAHPPRPAPQPTALRCLPCASPCHPGPRARPRGAPRTWGSATKDLLLPPRRRDAASGFSPVRLRQDGAVRLGTGRRLQGGCAVDGLSGRVVTNVVLRSLGLLCVPLEQTRPCATQLARALGRRQAPGASGLPLPPHGHTPVARRTAHRVQTPW